jgi:hypothetical protein
MNIQELTTWHRLLALDFDVADAALSFSRRLARDNGWPDSFAGRAVEEYRKFCFLAVHAGHPVTPSDEVDQVWHLHLLYSRHYWEALCRDTLETPLHHGPTAGGVAEGRKYRSWYEDTLASYRRYFGEAPRDLWPATGERFHEQDDFVRVNRRDVVTLDRTLLRRGAIAAAAGTGVLAVAHAFAQANDAGSSESGVLVVAVIALVVVALLVTAVRSARARARGAATTLNRGRDKRRAGAAAAAGGVSGDSSSKHSSNDNDGAGDSGGGATDGGQGCGAASGCGGGGCGGGGS